ncbi:acyltransferase [uncultured Caulobacter sp.]|uniref:acyltransferase family protein n=1 Tax=uncultured Caulobacter sp. TaxID=158749 RepID=UPI002604234D|nr:acyltransferase [uncultured Caulobacter sp.]
MQLRGESVGLEGGAGKYNGIQCLRLVAAFIVILMHSTFYLKERLVPEYPIWLNGARGVDIFFTISGFVMFVSSKRLSGISGIKTFCEKRAIRILPLYWFVTTLKLAIMIVVPGVALHSSIEAVYVLKSYLLIPSENVEGNVEPLLGVGWTLILEFFFYGVFAIGLLARRKILEFCSIVLLAFFAISFFRSSNWRRTEYISTLEFWNFSLA